MREVHGILFFATVLHRREARVEREDGRRKSSRCTLRCFLQWFLMGERKKYEMEESGRSTVYCFFARVLQRRGSRKKAPSARHTVFCNGVCTV